MPSTSMPPGNSFQNFQYRDGTFYLPDGSTVTVPMMHQTENLNYAEGDSYQAVELKYDGNELSMLIILPEDGNFEQFKATFDAENWLQL